MAKKLLLVFLVFSASLGSAQTFWTEAFGAGCNQAQLANGLNAGGNGPWVVTNTGANDPFANTWYISAEENGGAVGTCGTGCGANRTLHVANVPGSPSAIFCPTGDCGAAYDTGISSAQVSTDKRAESPTINCTGQSTITLSFDYMTFGDPGNDFCQVYYFDGVVWNLLGLPALTTCGNTASACSPCACGSAITAQGIWSNMSFPLPVSANNNPSVKVGFRWKNNDDATGTDPSFAVDNIKMTSVTAVASFTPSFVLTPSICVGGVTNVTANTGTTAATGYTWSASPAGPAIATPNGASTNITFATPGVFSITLTVASGTVIGTATNTIAVIPNPAVLCNASPNLVCLGNSSTLTANGATSYVWSPSTGLSSTSGATVISTPGTQQNYIVTGTTAGCTGTCAVTVSVNPAPSIGITANPSAVICPGGSTSLTATGGVSYTWSPSTGLSSTSGSVVVASPTTNQFYTLIGMDAAGCTGTTSINVTIGPPLTITVTPANTSTTCIGGNPVSYTATGASSYVWSPATGLSLTFGPLVTASPSTTTQYTVLGSTGTCTGQAVVTVSVLAAPQITVVPKSSYICFGATTDFTATGAATYTWSPAATLSSNTGATVTASPTLNPVSYSVVGQSIQGCLTNTAVVTMTVVPIPTQTISLQTNTLGVAGNSICATTPISTNFTIAVQSPIAPPGFAFTYSISPSTASTVIVPSPTVSAPNAFTIIPTVPPVQSLQTFTVISYYTGMQGCVSIADTVTIRIINCNAPVASFTTVAKNDTICTKGCITFMNTTTGGVPQTLAWNFPGGKPNTSTAQFPVICYEVPGTYTVDLTVTNPYGGPSYTVKNKYIVVVDTPNTKGLKDTCIRFGKSVQLFGTLASHFSWYPNTYLSCPPGSPPNCNPALIPNPIASPTVNTQYIVTGYNSKKCHYNDTIDVCVIADCGDMFVPNAFSPNKDGVNDLLYVRGKCLQNMTFQVFNRWGELVWETNDQSKGWDGNYNGELMNTGVFVFRLVGTTISNEPYSLKGNVTLIR